MIKSSRRRRDRGHISSLVAATTDAYGGVPEPALSEPAQQLIGVRSGGERGHYCTTTPRLEKIRYINQLLVNGQTFPRGKGREVEEGEEGEERVASRHLIRRTKGGREINDDDDDEDDRDDDDDHDHDDGHDEDEDEDKDKDDDHDDDDDDDDEKDKDEEEEDKGEDLLTCLDTQSWSKLFKHTCPRVTALTRAFTAVLTSPITTNSSLSPSRAVKVVPISLIPW